ncbi:hypothetical protein NHQ30_009440 [Ciborinia camelliae]|nr:hypothetical protein NHQ30_009440 [Ciborinia camelliae]
MSLPTNFDTYTRLLMENTNVWSISFNQFLKTFNKMTKDAEISAKEWRENISAHLSSQTLINLAPIDLPPKRLERFVTHCQNLVHKPKYGDKKSTIKVVQEGSIERTNISEYRGGPMIWEKCAGGPFKTSPGEKPKFHKDRLLTKPRVFMNSRPGVAVSSWNKRGIILFGGSKSMEVGDEVICDAEGKTVRVSGFEGDGRPFFEIDPVLVTHDLNKKEVWKMGYDANGKCIDALFDECGELEGIYEGGYVWSKSTKTYDGYIRIDQLVDNDKGLLVDDVA